MALPKIGFNEGSLLRRTLLHVGTFVLGSMAFIGIMSFLLVSIAKGIVSPRAESAEDEGDTTAATAPSAGARAAKAPGGIKPAARRGRGIVPPTPTPPSKDD